MRRFACVALLLGVPLVHAADPAGRWRGSVAIPGAPAVVEIDLDRGAKGDWVGSLTAPEFKLRGSPLLELKVAEAHVDATLSEMARREGPKAGFALTLENDGRLRGTFHQAGLTAPFELQRIGEADVQLPRASTAVPKAWEGEWKGDFIGTGGYARHVTLTLRNDGKGPAQAECVIVGKITTTLHVNLLSAAQDYLEIGSAEGIGVEGHMQANAKRFVGSLGYGGLEFPMKLERTP